MMHMVINKYAFTKDTNYYFYCCFGQLFHEMFYCFQHPIMVTLAWTISFALLLVTVLSPHFVMYQHDRIFYAFYNGMRRQVWLIGVSWLIYACAHGYAGNHSIYCIQQLIVIFIHKWSFSKYILVNRKKFSYSKYFWYKVQTENSTLSSDNFGPMKNEQLNLKVTLTKQLLFQDPLTVFLHGQCFNHLDGQRT